MSRTLADLLVRQLEVTWAENNWFAALAQLLEHTTAEQAVWRPSTGGHTIYELVRHLAYSEQEVTARLGGRPPQWDSALGWPQTPAALTTEQWQATIADMQSSHQRFAAAIAALDDETLIAPREVGRRYLDLAQEVIAHEAFHGGQIAYIRRLQGLTALM